MYTIHTIHAGLFGKRFMVIAPNGHAATYRTYAQAAHAAAQQSAAVALSHVAARNTRAMNDAQWANRA